MQSLQFGAIIPQGCKGEFAGLLGDQCALAASKYACAIEAGGFASGWVYDHLIAIQPSGTPCLEAWMTISGVASTAPRLRLGTMVTSVTFRNPTHLAKIAATVDAFMGGRLEFGIGAGWFAEEHRQYGFPLPSPRERVNRLEEALQVIVQLWSEEKATFHGQYYTANEAWCSPKPVQCPHPPIWVGGGGEKRTLGIAARFADKWNLTSGTCAEFERKGAILTERCHEIGRDPASIVRTVEQYCILGHRHDVDALAAQCAKSDGIPDSQFRSRHLVGTPDEVEARIREYAATGVSYFVLWFADAPRTTMLERFSREVMPRFRL